MNAKPDTFTYTDISQGKTRAYEVTEGDRMIGTVRRTDDDHMWRPVTPSGQVLLKARLRSGAAMQLRAADAIVRRHVHASVAVTSPAAGPEVEDCRCAAKLNGSDISHRSVHDVHEPGTCPCICHRTDGRDAETMPHFAQFNIGALADRVTRAVLEHPGPNHPNRVKADVLAEAWCVLTGLPRAQALHIAAELCGRHAVAVTSPF